MTKSKAGKTKSKSRIKSGKKPLPETPQKADKVKCQECDGSGEVDCEECRGLGEDDDGIECNGCGGDCVQSCWTCDGTGEAA